METGTRNGGRYERRTFMNIVQGHKNRSPFAGDKVR
jgi:hypothetical protein